MSREIHHHAERRETYAAPVRIFRGSVLLGYLTLAFLLLATQACDDVTPRGYVELVEGSRECSADADCVLAGEGTCTCASPVNESAQEEVDTAAADLDCENVTTTMCPAHDNLRCEEARCVSDGSP